jgi:DNA-binding LytR/AlgR family response regulator
VKVLIIEDEAPAYRRLYNLLNAQASALQVIDVLDSVADSIKWFNENPTPDLIFSDIQLADGLSFEIFNKIQIACPIIFTTAYDEYMMEAFKTNGIDYLLKPIDEKSLTRSIEKFESLITQNGQSSSIPNIESLLASISSEQTQYKTRFLVKLGTKLIPVSIDGISCFCSKDGSTEIIMSTGKKYIIDQTLDELERRLDPKVFFRFNRKILGRFSSVQTVHQYFKGKLKVEMLPKLDEEVIISREKAKAFKLWLEGS